MNQVLKTIAERYSCRNFDGVMPEEAKIQAIAQAAIQAPSAMNRQGWRVIVVRNTALIQEMDAEGMSVLAAMPDKSGYERIMSRGGALFYHAPCMIMVPIDPAEYGYAMMDCGILAQNVALAAAAQGLDSVICGLARTVFAGEKGRYFKEKLGFPEGYDFGIAVLVGHAAAPPVAPHTPDQAKISYVD